MSSAPFDPTSFFVGLLNEISPERRHDLERCLQDKSIEFFLNSTEQRILFRADPGRSAIEVGIRCLRRLWIHAYASACACYVTSAKFSSPHRTAEEDAQIEECLDLVDGLLTWAVQCEVNVKLKQRGYSVSDMGIIVPGLPDRFDKELREKQRRVGEGLFRNALAFILYHEISHLELAHVPCRGLESIEQEKEADRRAVNWLLGATGLSEEESICRGNGIAIGLSWLVIADIYCGPGSSSTHPPSYDRLYQTVHHIVESHDEVQAEMLWGVLFVALWIHVHKKELIAGHDWITPSFQTNVNYLIDKISRIPAR